MKCKTKTVLTLICVMVVFVTIPGIKAIAGSYTTGNINGFTVSGSVVTNSTAAIANTVFPLPDANKMAVATVYYREGSKYYSNSALSSSSQSGGVAATAYMNASSGTVVGGQGTHSLSYEGYSWNDYTSTGTIPTVTSLQ